MTPLHWAAGKGQFEICKLIIEIAEEKNPADSSGFTPLYNASSCGYFEICQFLDEPYSIEIILLKIYPPFR